MARLKYTCTLNLDIDDQEYPIPVDGDFSTELYDILDELIHECEGLYLTTMMINKSGRKKG